MVVPVTSSVAACPYCRREGRWSSPLDRWTGEHPWLAGTTVAVPLSVLVAVVLVISGMRGRDIAVIVVVVAVVLALILALGALFVRRDLRPRPLGRYQRWQLRHPGLAALLVLAPFGLWFLWSLVTYSGSGWNVAFMVAFMVVWFTLLGVLGWRCLRRHAAYHPEVVGDEVSNRAASARLR